MRSLHRNAPKSTEIKNQLTPKLTPETLTVGFSATVCWGFASWADLDNKSLTAA